MKKIMFSERYGLEQAVLAGTKTMTRRIIPIDLYNQTDWKAVAEGDFEAVVDGEGYYHDIRNCGKYRVGEEVAIAQSYKDLWAEYLDDMDNPIYKELVENFSSNLFSAGHDNKMFVKADLMPHRIRITGIKVERLQDISDEDCLQEGLLAGEQEPRMYGFRLPKRTVISFLTPREAFAALIDRISGRGTWQSNPWVYAYTFELIK